MAATLTIDRSNLGLADLVIGTNDATGFTLDPSFSMGTVSWRKATSEAPNVPGRTMGDYTRDTMVTTGSIKCYGLDTDTDPTVGLQSRISEVITALTQVDPTEGFRPFTMTYTHGTAVYKWTCTEPGDCSPGDDGGVLSDMEMADNFQSIHFANVRDPIPLEGPI